MALARAGLFLYQILCKRLKESPIFIINVPTVLNYLRWAATDEVIVFVSLVLTVNVLVKFHEGAEQVLLGLSHVACVFVDWR